MLTKEHSSSIRARNIPHLPFRWHWLLSRAVTHIGSAHRVAHEWRIDLLVIVCALRPASGHPTTIFFLSSLQWSALYPSSRCLSIHPFGFEGHGNAFVRRPAVRCEPEEVSFGSSQGREAIYSIAGRALPQCSRARPAWRCMEALRYYAVFL